MKTALEFTDVNSKLMKSKNIALDTPLFIAIWLKTLTTNHRIYYIRQKYRALSLFSMMICNNLMEFSIKSLWVIRIITLWSIVFNWTHCSLDGHPCMKLPVKLEYLCGQKLAIHFLEEDPSKLKFFILQWKLSQMSDIAHVKRPMLKLILNDVASSIPKFPDRLSATLVSSRKKLKDNNLVLMGVD